MTNAPMKARAIDSFPAPTLDEIKRFEARNGVVLPEEYVEFLLASNGGLFTGEYALVGPPGGDRGDAIDLLYALNAPFDFWDLQTAAQDWRELCPNRRGFLPVGRDPYGNDYCLKVSRKLFGVFGGGRKKRASSGCATAKRGKFGKSPIRSPRFSTIFTKATARRRRPFAESSRKAASTD